MAEITIGSAAINRGFGLNGSSTYINDEDSASGTGTIDSFEIYCSGDITVVKIGTFSGSGVSWDDRDYEVIGSVSSGSKQTFSGLDCDVVSGDKIGCYFEGGFSLDYDSNAPDIFSKAGDQFGSGAQTYSNMGIGPMSVYGFSGGPNINVGQGATERASQADFSIGATYLDYGNPANASGTLESFEIWADNTISSSKMGTFSGSGTSWDDRDYEILGSIASGSRQTFSGLDCDVEADDIIGMYASTGDLDRDTSGGNGILFKLGDQFGSGSQSYTDFSDDAISLYALGESTGWSNIAGINGVLVASIGFINGVAVASVGTLNGTVV